jgi:formylglycine-generating enzyme required for sulfatase activity
VGYIVPVDALDPNRHSANFYEKAMPITELNTIALEIKARHALFLFDSCFSGSVFQSRSQTVPPTDRRQYLRDVQSEPVRQLIAAGRANEKVPGRSTFTPLLIDLLSGKRRASDDQYLTGSDIGRWLTQHLPSFVPDQHPHSGFVRGRWDLGDMVFQLRSTSPPPPPPPGNTPGQPLPRDCAACPDLVYVPPGDFVMGSPDGEKDRDSDEGPTHAVRITYALAVGRNEVSRGEFAQFVQAAGHKTDAESSGQGCSVWSGKEWAYDAALTWRKPGFDQTDDHPVVCVSWQDAQAYVAWLNDHHRGGKPYRLLSEAEWEYAARAGQGGKRFPWGDDEGYSVMCRYANAADQAAKKGVPGWATVADSSFAKCDDGFAYTAPAYTLTANAFGLHHMHGNVWEWVQDVYHDTYKGAPADGSAWESGGAARRVLRGGSWRDIPRNLRSANRDSVAPDIRNIDAGFRVARTF